MLWLSTYPSLQNPFTVLGLEYKGSTLSPCYSSTHTHSHTYTVYTHTHTQSSDGASGSATMFPGSLTGLMEALCLKPGQTAADSRGDAYQLLAMLRPRGQREGEREGERDKERERKRERGGYSKMHCIKKEPASVWKLGWNSAHLNTPAWHFKSRQVFVFFLRGPDIDMDVLLQQCVRCFW